MATDELDHAAVKRLFLEATALLPGERAAFLDRACAGNARLRAEIESLLGYHDPRTLLQPVQAAGKRRVLAAAMAGVVLVGALLADAALRRTTLQAATARLAALVEERADAVAAWTKARFDDAGTLAIDPDVVDAVPALAALATAQDADVARRLRGSPAAHRVENLAVQALRDRRLDVLALVDRDGRVLAGGGARVGPAIEPGQRLPPVDRLALGDVWRGAMLMLSPEPLDARGAANGGGAALTVYVATAVQSPPGEQLAALVLAFPWDETLLEGEEPGSGEQVRLLNSRGQPCTGEADAGRELDRAAAEIAAWRSGSSSAPYADVYGTARIGAWRWIAPGVGLVVELPVDEALAPRRFVHLALLLLAAAAAIVLVITAWRMVPGARPSLRESRP